MKSSCKSNSRSELKTEHTGAFQFLYPAFLGLGLGPLQRLSGRVREDRWRPSGGLGEGGSCKSVWVSETCVWGLLKKVHRNKFPRCIFQCQEERSSPVIYLNAVRSL